MSIEQPRAIVSALLLHRQEGVLKIFLQTRWKPKSSPTYSGMLEIPAGGGVTLTKMFIVPLKEKLKKKLI